MRKWRRLTRNWTEREKIGLVYKWKFWSRPNQQVKRYWNGKRWRIKGVVTGRGYGKTKMGGEWIREEAEKESCYNIIVGRTFTQVRDTMIEGESGLLNCFPYWAKPRYYPSRLRLVLRNGSIIQGHSADDPDSIRGPNTKNIWGDEFCSWEHIEAYKNARMCLRSGRGTRMLLTSTPNFSMLCDALFEDAENRPDKVHIIGGSTYENASNLDPDFLDDIKVFENTEYGDQEIHGLRLLQGRGALWSKNIIHKVGRANLPHMIKRILCVDPASSNTKDSDETGIIVMGQGADLKVYVLDDFSIKGGDPALYLPQILAAKKKWNLDTIVIEKNDGGLTIAHTIRNSGHGWRKIKDIYNTKQKRVRAQPVIPLYINKMVYHLDDIRLKVVEKQMCTVPIGEKNVTDDRMDAIVLGVHYLLPNLVRLRLKTNTDSLHNIIKDEVLKNVA